MVTTADKKLADKARHAAAHARRRTAALTAYGDRCACCDDNEVTFLTIDHITPGTPKTPRNSTGLCRWLEKNEYPDGFRVLCFNCNDGKHFRLECPHVSPVIPATSGTQWFRSLKEDVIAAYGGTCAGCGERGLDFLHLDHEDGDGKKHRQELTGKDNPGSLFYRKLRELGFPNSPKLRILCANCNYATTRGTCPHQKSRSQPW